MPSWPYLLYSSIVTPSSIEANFSIVRWVQYVATSFAEPPQWSPPRGVRSSSGNQPIIVAVRPSGFSYPPVRSGATGTASVNGVIIQKEGPSKKRGEKERTEKTGSRRKQAGVLFRIQPFDTYPFERNCFGKTRALFLSL